MSVFPAWKMPLRAAFLGFAAASAMLAQGALAQESGGGELRKLCADDFKKYCADVTPGKGKMRECIQQNFDKLSEPCRAGIEERRKNKSKS